LTHQVVPPVLPQQTEGDQVLTQEPEKVAVPPTVECSPKEKALVPDSEKAAEGVPAMKKMMVSLVALCPLPQKILQSILHS
jgi:hypothetical protein